MKSKDDITQSVSKCLFMDMWDVWRPLESKAHEICDRWAGTDRLGLQMPVVSVHRGVFQATYFSFTVMQDTADAKVREDWK